MDWTRLNSFLDYAKVKLMTTCYVAFFTSPKYNTLPHKVLDFILKLGRERIINDKLMCTTLLIYYSIRIRLFLCHLYFF